MTIQPYIKVSISLIVIALCSGMIGAAIALHFHSRENLRLRSADVAMASAEEWLAQRLDLTDAQRKQIQPFLDQAKKEIRTITTNSMAQVTLVRKHLHQEIRPLLTPQQNEELERLARLRSQAWERIRGTNSPSGSLRERIRERRNRRESLPEKP